MELILDKKKSSLVSLEISLDWECGWLSHRFPVPCLTCHGLTRHVICHAERAHEQDRWADCAAAHVTSWGREALGGVEWLVWLAKVSRRSVGSRPLCWADRLWSVTLASVFEHEHFCGRESSRFKFCTVTEEAEKLKLQSPDEKAFKIPGV